MLAIVVGRASIQQALWIGAGCNRPSPAVNRIQKDDEHVTYGLGHLESWDYIQVPYCIIIGLFWLLYFHCSRWLNSILHYPGADHEALLEVIGDYFYEGRGDTGGCVARLALHGVCLANPY